MAQQNLWQVPHHVRATGQTQLMATHQIKAIGEIKPFTLGFFGSIACILCHFRKWPSARLSSWYKYHLLKPDSWPPGYW